MLSINFNEIFLGGVGSAIGNKRLDLGDDPDREADPGIFKRNFCRYGTGTIVRNFR